MLNRINQKKEIETLFKEHYSKLYYYALNIIHDPENAKDIVSDAFHYIWEHYDDKVNDSLSILALLYTRIKNNCIDHIRHLDVIKRHEESILNDTSDTDTPLTKDDYIEREERITQLTSAIENLPQQTKIVFKKCFLEGKKYKEVSEEMNISVNTIKTHIMKALKILRSELKYKK